MSRTLALTACGPDLMFCGVHAVSTVQGYFQVVQPGAELSLEYKFYPDARLPSPRDFVVALTAFYFDNAGTFYSSTFFNQTVTIVEIPKLVDWELLSLIGLFVAALAAIGACIGPNWVHLHVCMLCMTRTYNNALQLT